MNQNALSLKEARLKEYRRLKAWHKKKLNLAIEAGDNSTFVDYLRRMVDYIDHRIKELKS